MNKCRTIFTAIFLCSSASLFSQSELLFKSIQEGKWEELQKYLNTTGTLANIRNSEGYTPLHWLIRYYIDYDVSIYFSNAEAAEKNIEQYENYRKCMNILIENGVNLQEKTPEGYNALQYAVLNGKWFATDKLLDTDKNHTIRDSEGNTLLHLSIYADKEKTIENFWTYLHDRILSDKVNIHTPNYAGQTPIAYYMSAPRKIEKNTFKMLDVLKSTKSLQAPDINGKNAMDYARVNNDWAVFSLQLYIDQATILEKEHAEFMEKFNKQIEENQRLMEEYEKQTVSGSGNRLLQESFSVTYTYECFPSNNNATNVSNLKCDYLDEEVTVTVTPTRVSISSLTPYYGSFEVESSGSGYFHGEEVDVYFFVKSNINSTYEAIVFPKGFNYGRAMIVNTMGFDIIANY